MRSTIVEVYVIVDPIWGARQGVTSASSYLGVQEGNLLPAEDLGDKGAARPEHVRDDGERREDQLGLHELVHVV